MERDGAMERLVEVVERWYVGLVLPGALLGLTVLPWLVLRSDLPDPVAVHVDGSGAADGSLPAAVLVLLTASLTVPAAAVLVWAGRRPGSGTGIEPLVVTCVAAPAAVLNLVLLLANRGAATWEAVTLDPVLVWVATTASLAPAVPLVASMRRRWQDGELAAAPPMSFAGTERVAWFGAARSMPFTVGAVLAVLLGAAALAALSTVSDELTAGLAITALSVVVVGVSCWWFTGVAVHVDARGVHVRPGAVGWPRMTLDLGHIEAARAIDLDPSRPSPGRGRWLILGWGYRGSLRLMGRAAWVVRKGPALELDLRGGRRFSVTVDEADEAAAVVNGLVARGTEATP